MKFDYSREWLKRHLPSEEGAVIEAGRLEPQENQMSWSFQCIGKPLAVAKAAQAQKETNKCAEPEETYRRGCLDYISAAAEQLIGQTAVQVNASGSMWKDGETVKSHTMQLDFKPLYGFVE